MPHFEFCIPKAAKAVPDGPDWIHEIKYDGYRARLVRDGSDIKLLSKAGLDWTSRFPFITEAALKLPAQHFAIDGEIVVLDARGISDFDALHSGRYNDDEQLYAFDLVVLDGDDLRELPLFERKNRLSKLLHRRPGGIFVVPFERGEVGPDLFDAACKMGLEGLVSKHRERRYRPRTCDWIKVKNRAHPRTGVSPISSEPSAKRSPHIVRFEASPVCCQRCRSWGSADGDAHGN